jgi:hypothetical protein
MLGKRRNQNEAPNAMRPRHGATVKPTLTVAQETAFERERSMLERLG